MNAIDYINNIIRVSNYEESIGVVLLKNGAALSIDSYFDYFFDSWMIYNHPERRTEIASPLISNGDIAIHLSSVAAMIKTPEGFEELEEEY